MLMHSSRGKIHYKLIFLVIILPSLYSTLILSESRPVIGYLEKIKLGNQALDLIAKIDSGADQSSLHAINPIAYRKQGQDWIKFAIDDIHGKRYFFDKQIIRYVFIKRKNQLSQKRPVVKFSVCVSSVLLQTEVNLSNRHNFKHPVLIGRSFLQGHFLIDTSQQFLEKPSCHLLSTR